MSKRKPARRAIPAVPLEFLDADIDAVYGASLCDYPADGALRLDVRAEDREAAPDSGRRRPHRRARDGDSAG